MEGDWLALWQIGESGSDFWGFGLTKDVVYEAAGAAILRKRERARQRETLVSAEEDAESSPTTHPRSAWCIREELLVRRLLSTITESGYWLAWPSIDAILPTN